MESNNSITENRIMGSVKLILVLFILFISLCWYTKLDQRDEVVINVEVTIPYSQIESPDFSKEYFNKRTILVSKRKTLVPLISTYDTLLVKDEGRWIKDKPKN
jgi:hypothetical protein